MSDIAILDIANNILQPHWHIPFDCIRDSRGLLCVAADQLPSCCSAVLAHYLLNEKLNLFGLLGGMLCVAGSLTIVLHAPEERPVTSLLQVWELALQPGMHMDYSAYVVVSTAEAALSQACTDFAHCSCKHTL